MNFKGEVIDTFPPKRFDCTAADFEKQFKKIDKGMVLGVIGSKGKDNNNYIDDDIDCSLSIKSY